MACLFLERSIQVGSFQRTKRSDMITKDFPKAFGMCGLESEDEAIFKGLAIDVVLKFHGQARGRAEVLSFGLSEGGRGEARGRAWAQATAQPTLY